MIASTRSKLPTDDCFKRPNNSRLNFTAVPYTYTSARSCLRAFSQSQILAR